MEQQNIREFNGQTFTLTEAAAWLKELDDRTKSAQPDRNSINELATIVQSLSQNKTDSGGFSGTAADLKQAIDSLSSFTVQEINTGGNYNDLEITADLVIFTNEDGQAIINGIWGKKQFHVLNASTQFEIQFNDNSQTVTGDGQPISTPTTNGSGVGVKGTCRILYGGPGYGYYVADVYASLGRPEFGALTKPKITGVDTENRATTHDIIEPIVFRDAQNTPMSAAELDAAYPGATRPFEVVCKDPNVRKIYFVLSNSPREWGEKAFTAL